MEQSLRDPRPEKVAVVAEVREKLTAANAAILTEYRGLPVSQIETLRRALTAAGGEYKVYKNTLVRRAADECGLGVLGDMLEGPTAIAFVNDDVAAVAKVLRDFARTNPSLVVKGGLLGTNLLDARQTSALAELPSKVVLLAQIAGAFAAPMQRFASLLQAVPQKFAYALAALLEHRGGDVTPAAAETTPVDVDEPSGGSAGAIEGATDPAATDPSATDPAAADPAAADPSGTDPGNEAGVASEEASSSVASPDMSAGPDVLVEEGESDPPAVGAGDVDSEKPADGQSATE